MKGPAVAADLFLHILLPWTNEVEEAIKTWLSQTYEQRENEEPDQEFLQYVMEMIKGGTNMGDIKKELMDLGTEEATASEFVNDMEVMLRKIGEEQSTKVEVQTITTTATTAKDTPTAVPASEASANALLSGPLKSGREGGGGGGGAGGGRKKDVSDEQSKKEEGSGGARLLNSALQSSRFAKQTNKRENNEKFINQDGKDNKNTKRNDFDIDNDKHGNKRQRQQQPVVDSKDPVAYFEEMNRIAIQSGFKNAQEMLASQKEIMAMMNPAAPPAMPPAPQMAFYPPMPFYPPPPQQGMYPPTYAPMDPMIQPPLPPSPHYMSSSGRFPHQGRGFGGRAAGRRPPFTQGTSWTRPKDAEDTRPPPPTTAPPASSIPSEVKEPAASAEVSNGDSENASSTPAQLPSAIVAPTPTATASDPSSGGRFGGRGLGGRGRGGGRWNPPAVPVSQPSVPVNPFAVHSSSNPPTSDAAATATPASDSSFLAAQPAFPNQFSYGRSSFAGRGGRGRGRGRAAPAASMTWVRPDLQASQPTTNASL
eukprot:scaffold147_cov164-Ochromonas_danica.AAC.22